MSSVDLGDVPTWIAAVFAGGAALFAGLTIKSQRQQISEQQAFIAEQSANLSLERAELRAAQEQRRWAQAKQVVMQIQTGGFSQLDEEGNTIGYSRWDVFVSNNSDEPVRNVMVRFGDAYNAASAVEVESTDLPDQGRRGVPVDVIGPGRTVHFKSSSWLETTVDNNRPALQFTDSAGEAWRRDQHGVLTAVEE